jgi:MshEN domain
MRIQLGDPSRANQLRDYFRRLGAIATVNGDGTVEVTFADGDGADFEAYLASWSTINGVSAAVVPATPPVPAAASTGFEVVPRVGSDVWTPPMRLGDLLVSKGFITNEQLGEALVESRQTQELLGLVLLRRRWIFEDELARTLAQQWNLPYLNLRSVGVDAGAMRLLPAEVGMRTMSVPVRFADGAVQVAFADPSDQRALEEVRSHLRSISVAVAELTDITMLWQQALRAAGAA